jgi:hypothetical protein
VVNEHGVRVAVLLDIEFYQKMLDALEELEGIRASDEAKAAGDKAIPFEEAVEEIEKQRQGGTAEIEGRKRPAK